MQCPNCRFDNQPTAKFCRSCGQRLPQLRRTCGGASGGTAFCHTAGLRCVSVAVGRLFSVRQPTAPAHDSARSAARRNRAYPSRRRPNRLYLRQPLPLRAHPNCRFTSRRSVARAVQAVIPSPVAAPAANSRVHAEVSAAMPFGMR